MFDVKDPRDNLAQVALAAQPVSLPRSLPKLLASQPCRLAVMFSLLVSMCGPATLWAQSERYFGIQVVDADTGRGVPLVELRTTNGLSYVTDSQGWVAFDEPGLLGEKVFFHIESHGYEYPKDFLGQQGRAFATKPGGRAQIELQRVNLAERLYRVTGQGIYADSLRLGEPVPLTRPVLSGLVTGQDSVQNALVDETLYWFWGDTNRPSYPLGHFGTSVAKSVSPTAGGLAAEQGVDLEYYVDAQGFSEPAFDSRGGLMTWFDGVMVVRPPEGPARIVGHYSVMKSLGERLEHGLAVFDSETGKFEKTVQWPVDAVLEPGGQVLLVPEPDGPYFYFCTPFPSVRVRATWEAVKDPSAYQALTPLVQGTRFRGADTQLATDLEGTLDYGWKTGTPPLRPTEEARLVKLGRLSKTQAHWQTADADSDHPVILHSGNVTGISIASGT